MLKVRPIESKETQAELCRECGVEYKPDALAYSAYEDEEFLGITQFILHGGKAYMTDLVNKIGVNDREALFIMGRAALNYIDLHGTHTAVFTSVTEENEKFIRAVGFKPNEEGTYIMDLEGFFVEPCKH